MKIEIKITKIDDKKCYGIGCCINPPTFKELVVRSSETFNTFEDARKALIDCVVEKNRNLNKQNIIAATFFENDSRITIECEEKGVFNFYIFEK